MSETNGLFSRIVLSGSLGAGRLIAGDYVLRITDIENGHRLTVSKGNDVQTMDVLNGETGATGPAGQDGQPGQPGQDGQDGVSPTVDVDEITGGHRVTITDADGAHVFDVMDGATGPQGPAGQDAVIDATLTQAGQAADAKKTGDEITEIKDALSELPKGVQVAGTDLTPGADGKVNVPLASTSNAGVIKVPTAYGLYMVTSDSIGIIVPSNERVDSKSGTYAITLARIDRAVRAGLLSNSQITSADKPAICQTIGAEPAKGAWVLKGTMTTDNKSDDLIVDLSGCTELIIKGYAIGTAPSTLRCSHGNMVNSLIANGNRTFVIKYKDELFGLVPAYAIYNNSVDAYTLPFRYSEQYGYNNGSKVSGITKIWNTDPDNITECHIEVYAR